MKKRKFRKRMNFFFNKIYDVYKNKIKENNEKLVKLKKKYK